MLEYEFETHDEMVQYRSIGKEKLSITVDKIANLYLKNDKAWVIGFSGGKDSTVVLSLVFQALTTLKKEQLTKKVYVVCSDTLVETPVVVGLIRKTLKDVQECADKKGIPLITQVVIPEINETFWSNLLGKGYPAPTKSFRWCTERMKINPVSEFIQGTVSNHGEVIVALGSRSQESATRAQSIAKHSIKGSELARHSSLPNAFTYMPIEDWHVDDVWEYLLSSPSPWGGSNEELFILYKGSNQGECPIVIDKTTPSCGNSRFGCWTCTVVNKDKAIHGLVESGEDWMKPLLEFRDELHFSTLPENKATYRNHKRRSGKITFQTTYVEGEGRSNEIELNAEGIGVNVPGPYWLDVRKKWLKNLLKIERDINNNGHDIELISRPELHIIRREWIADPNEPDWEDSLPKIYQEIYPDDSLEWSSNDLGFFGPEGLESVQNAGEEVNVSPELLKKIIDVEVEISGLGSRRGINNKIESILKKDWESVEEAFEVKQAQSNATNEFKSKRDKFQSMLGDFS
jgi:DNA sulfur modification protein DndC